VESKRSAPLIEWNSFLNPTSLCRFGPVAAEFRHQRRAHESSVEPVLYFLDILTRFPIVPQQYCCVYHLHWNSGICREVRWKSADVSEERNASKCKIRLYLLLASMLIFPLRFIFDSEGQGGGSLLAFRLTHIFCLA
jgi:hypothetical protein